MTEESNVMPLKPGFPKGYVPPNRRPRQKGSLNKITRDIKNGIIDAAILHGEDGKGKGGLTGYLKMCATRHPKNYMRLIARVLPYTITAEIEANAMIHSVNIIPVPVKMFVPAEQVQLTVDDSPAVPVTSG